MMTAPSKSYIRSKANIIYGLIMISFSISTAFALYTYDAGDDALSVSSTNNIRNILGRYGAILSDIMLQFFGFSSLLMVFTILLWGINAIRHRRYNITFRMRVIMLLLAITSLSILLGSFVQYNFKWQMFPGGYVGYSIFTYLLKYFHEATIICFFIILLFIMVKYMFSEHGHNKKNNLAILSLARTYLIKILYQCALFFYNVITLKFILSFIKRRKKKSIISKAVLKIDDSHYTQNVAVQGIKNSTSVNYSTSDSHYNPPSFSLLLQAESVSIRRNINIDAQAKQLVAILLEFGVKASIAHYHQGPVVTLFELRLTPGTKASRVIGISNDIARTMGAISIRIAVIPGKDVIGVEIPNEIRQPVVLRSLVESQEFKETAAHIPIVLGKNIIGQPMIADLTRMPHLLIAGTTGSGKSVGMNSMILSILYKMSPKECRLIMIDPKMLEFSVYDGIPHLLSPVITDAKKAIIALKWLVVEMERRYKLMLTIGIRSIIGYNDRITAILNNATKFAQYNASNGNEMPEYMPYIVVIIDEMADLMLVAGKELESLVQRLAQMARAAGIHIIMATQRPSVDVITGVIKANFPTRVSYQVTSKIDSRTILGEQGAEQLLGNGDMLYMLSGGKIHRAHGTFVSDDEVSNVVQYLRDTYETHYIDIESCVPSADHDYIVSGDLDSDETLYQEAIKIVINDQRPSISYIQRKLRIGYNRAANMIERMEAEGILTAADISGKRSIIKTYN